MAKKNARNEVNKKRQAVNREAAKDKAERQAGIQKQLKNKKNKKTGYYSHSKGI